MLEHFFQNSKLEHNLMSSIQIANIFLLANTHKTRKLRDKNYLETKTFRNKYEYKALLCNNVDIKCKFST